MNQVASLMFLFFGYYNETGMYLLSADMPKNEDDQQVMNMQKKI